MFDPDEYEYAFAAAAGASRPAAAGAAAAAAAATAAALSPLAAAVAAGIGGSVGSGSDDGGEDEGALPGEGEAVPPARRRRRHPRDQLSRGARLLLLVGPSLHRLACRLQTAVAATGKVTWQLGGEALQGMRHSLERARQEAGQGFAERRGRAGGGWRQGGGSGMPRPRRLPRCEQRCAGLSCVRQRPRVDMPCPLPPLLVQPRGQEGAGVAGAAGGGAARPARGAAAAAAAAVGGGSLLLLLLLPPPSLLPLPLPLLLPRDAPPLARPRLRFGS